MKTKEELNAKALTDEKLTGVHGGMKIILRDKLTKMQEEIIRIMKTMKERRNRDK